MKFGNSLALHVPKDIAARLGLTESLRVDVKMDTAGRIIMTPVRRRYMLDELLAQCDLKTPASPEDRARLEGPRVGDELV